MTSMTEQIAALDKLSTAELAAEYERLHGRQPRYRSPRWMVKRIAFQLQAAAYGGLSRPVRAELHRLAADIKLLTRTWHGELVRVEVTADGGFIHNGERFQSLSAVAKRVTGQHWSGPRFFNLTSRNK